MVGGVVLTKIIFETSTPFPSCTPRFRAQVPKATVSISPLSRPSLRPPFAQGKVSNDTHSDCHIKLAISPQPDGQTFVELLRFCASQSLLFETLMTLSQSPNGLTQWLWEPNQTFLKHNLGAKARRTTRTRGTRPQR